MNFLYCSSKAESESCSSIPCISFSFCSFKSLKFLSIFSSKILFFCSILSFLAIMSDFCLSNFLWCFSSSFNLGSYSSTSIFPFLGAKDLSLISNSPNWSSLVSLSFIEASFILLWWLEKIFSWIFSKREVNSWVILAPVKLFSSLNNFSFLAFNGEENIFSEDVVYGSNAFK